MGLNLGAFVLNEARGISATGRVIVGTGTNGQGNTEAWRVEMGPPPCVADMDDGSGTGTPDGGVGIEDLLYYLGQYDAGTTRADVDNGTGTGTPDGGVGIEDLLYFLQRYDAGC